MLVLLLLLSSSDFLRAYCKIAFLIGLSFDLMFVFSVYILQGKRIVFHVPRIDIMFLSANAFVTKFNNN